MYILTVETSFAAAHQLRGYKGKCENMHGHNWRVELSIKGDSLNATGLLLDFTDLKAMLQSVTDYLDHKNLNDLPPFDAINPSSENIAKFLCEKITGELHKKDPRLDVEKITVWESNTSRCTYIP